MVKVELPESNEAEKPSKEVATAASKANDAKFLQPKDVSDVIMYLLSTPPTVNVSLTWQYFRNLILKLLFQTSDHWTNCEAYRKLKNGAAKHS